MKKSGKGKTAEAAEEAGWRAACRNHRRLFRLAIHDLSNPLAAARLLAELQRRGAAGAADQVDLADQLGRAADLLAGLRALFREGVPEPVSPRPLLEQAITLAASEAGRMGARLLLGHADESPVRAPRHLLLQCLLSGLLAACDGIRPGAQVVLLLSASAGDDGSRFSLEVSEPARLAPTADELWAFRRLVEETGGRLEVAPGDRPAGDPCWAFVLPRAEPVSRPDQPCC